MDAPPDEFDLRSRIDTMLRDHVDPPAAAALAGAIVRLFAQPEFEDRLAGEIEAAMSRAWEQYSLRDDLYEHPGESQVSARIAATAVARALSAQPKPPTLHLTPAQAEGLVRAIRYRGWSFRLVRLGDGTFGVRATAETEDVHRAGTPFTVSRMAPVRTDVLEAAFNAAMAIEHHEARERFTVAGRRPFDPHEEAGGIPSIALQLDVPGT